jgi:YHS domain-containing protein
VKPVVIAFVILVVAAGSSSAQMAQVDRTVPMNMSSRGLMIEGYDPIAYIDYGEATPGVAEMFFDYRQTYRFYFASKVTMKKFMSDPERYLPAYGGHCAWMMTSGEGDLRGADPKLFKVVDDRVFLFSSAEALEDWSRDEAGSIARADANWNALIEKRRQKQ